jgi:hypothetical protein
VNPILFFKIHGVAGGYEVKAHVFIIASFYNLNLDVFYFYGLAGGLEPKNLNSNSLYFLRYGSLI